MGSVASKKKRLTETPSTPVPIAASTTTTNPTTTTTTTAATTTTTTTDITAIAAITTTTTTITKKVYPKTNWQIDKYEITSILGKGGYAEVVAARNPNDDKLYAIKIILKKENAESISEESDILRRIGEHKHIVGFYGDKHDGDYLHKGEPSKKTYLIYELCENGTLFDLVSTTGGFEEQLARTYFKHMFNAVEFMHKKGFSHRDLKPENLLLDKNWILKVADLGLACKNDKNGIVTDGKAVGTPGFLAPEVHEGAPYGTANDVFALGVLLFCSVLARPPFETSKTTCPWFNKIYEKDWTTYWRWQAHGAPLNISEELKQIIQKFFVINPQHRITIPEIKMDQWFLEPIYDDEKLPTKVKSILPDGDPLYSNRETELEGTELDFDIDGVNRGPPTPLNDWNIAPRTSKENDVAPQIKTMERGDSSEEVDESSYQFLLTYNPPVRSYTKWSTDDNPCIVLSALKNICDNDDDIDYKEDNFLLYCTCTDPDNNGKMHEFAIQIFKKEKSKYEEGHQCVVEFGRRSSDSAYFRKLFTSFRNQLDCYVLKEKQ